MSALGFIGILTSVGFPGSCQYSTPFLAAGESFDGAELAGDSARRTLPAFKYEDALQPDTMAQTAGRIVEEVHDEPHVAGRRITVRFLQQQVEERGLDPGVVAEKYDLALADVYRALAYYHDHPEEMDEVERRRREVVDEHREEAVTGPDELE